MDDVREERPLTVEEREVLAHVVVDPEAWWLHCQTVRNSKNKDMYMIRDPEKALADKVSRWKPEFDAQKLELTENYKDRSVRQAEADAEEEKKRSAMDAEIKAAQKAKEDAKADDAQKISDLEARLLALESR